MIGESIDKYAKFLSAAIALKNNDNWKIVSEILTEELKKLDIQGRFIDGNELYRNQGKRIQLNLILDSINDSSNLFAQLKAHEARLKVPGNYDA